MSRVGTKQHVFQEIANAYIRGEVAIDEMRELYEREGFWTAEELVRADREWKNSDLRRRARKPIRDEQGNVRELVNIKRRGAVPRLQELFKLWPLRQAGRDVRGLLAVTPVYFSSKALTRSAAVFAAGVSG